jgi:hypothetical protein
VPHNYQAIIEVRAQIEVIGGVTHERSFDQPPLLGLSAVIFVSFASDELA